MNLGKTLLILLTVASSGLLSQAQSLNFKQYTLKNGLRVILAEDRSAPTYSIAVTYDVGSRNEKPGRTGFAHLFEHMMFQGSENIGKGEHFIIIENNGGGVNGTTNADRTNYFQTLPSNQLDLGLFLEADRMRSLVINQANLDNQRETVKEERRSRVDNQPYGLTRETLLDLTYDNFGYKHPTIGSMADLDAATLADVSEFFKMYYAPNNAVLTLVGDFKTEDALARVRKHFESIPSQPAPPKVDVTEPEQKAERRKTLEDPLAQVARLDIVFKIPPGNTPDWYALSVAGSVLTDGLSSRLYQKLVKEKQVVLNISAGPLESRGPALMSFFATVRPGVDPKEVEKMIYEEIELLKTEPVLDTEIDKVRIGARRGNVEQLAGTLGRAIMLGQAAVYYGDPGVVTSWEARVRAVTKEQIQQAVRTYLKDTNRTVVTTIPKPRASSPGGPGRIEEN